MIEKSMMIEPHVYSLLSIIENLISGEIRVPPFQRDFVWTRDDIKELFDSLKKGYPIGSIIIWKPKEIMDWNENNIIGAFDISLVENNRNCYILDGYQRLSTLFCCLTNPFKTHLASDSELYSQLFELYYNLDEDIFEYARVPNAPTAVQVPLYVLLSTSEFRQYSRKCIEPNVPAEKLDGYLNRADMVSRQLIDYKISVIEINNANIEEAVDIFSRINSKGMDISLDWMVNALSYRDKNFRFADIIDKLIDELKPYNFDGIKRDSLFRCIQSSFGKLYIDQTDIESLAKRDDFAEITKSTIPYIKKAVSFLHDELHVLDSRLLPYNIQLIFFMEFFRKIHNPSIKQINDLKRWFWVTSYSNYFTIYSLSNQRKAYNQFVDYLRGKDVDILYTDNRETPFSVSSFPNTIRLSNVRSKVLVLFYLDQLSQKNININAYYPVRLFMIPNRKYNSAENFIYISNTEMLQEMCSNNEDIVEQLIEKQWDKHFYINDEFIQNWKSHNYESALKIRKETVMQAEKDFVEKYSMKY